jgi:hypothetical protein
MTSSLNSTPTRARDKRTSTLTRSSRSPTHRRTRLQCGPLRVDARKWKASKLAPKRYGDKMDLNHSGNLKIEGVRRTIYDPRHTDSEDIQPAS